MNTLIDTHFLIWIALGSGRLSEFPWLDRYRPWGVSPVSFLELQFLAEVGKLEVESRSLIDAVSRDPRFVLDEPPLLALVRHSLDCTWTRDPFDRLVAGHSLARRTPLCTIDGNMLAHHSLLLRELG